MLSKLDKTIVGLISQDIPLVKEPFRGLAHKLGIKEETLLGRIKFYKKNGLMRKFSASLNHRKVGFKHNVMAVWNVPDRLIDKAGNLMASFPEVSHCYERRRARDWNYNLYSMIHGRTKKECLKTVSDISKKTGCKDHRVLFSSREYKKSAARY
ncbi:MAG: Lrp/AsnC family transcriptional regulator [Candidatus Omnitrophota bacterium]|nr:Lrp/AsnC family transcriptional regulator [Candidatus Omnitrophota bacterium]